MPEQTGCRDGQACELTVDGKTACFAPVSIRGKVVNAADSTTPIVGAQIVARDDNGVAVTNVAVTDSNGAYALHVPAPRDAAGAPLRTTYTLRADAQGFAAFPSGVRVALPIDIVTAAGSPLTVENAATTIGLIGLADSTGLGSIHGTVSLSPMGAAAASAEAEVSATTAAGVLVVAESESVAAQGAATGVADKSGAYTIFNVPAGSYSVTGYSAGMSFTPVSATVAAGQTTSAVDLVAARGAVGRVGGTVSIVNAPGGSITSIVLAVESTFNENLGRGEVPRGLRAGDVTGAFAIENVPDGRYVVLAAFENDKLVRDPDTSIGNTATLHIAVAGGAVEAGNFKVTEALAVVAPGATSPEPVDAPPTFSWNDDSSEDGYIVEVFDNFGTKIWSDANVPSPKGGKSVAVPYGGPALVSGGWYQFRATSMKDGVPLSRTEDLLGVFVVR